MSTIIGTFYFKQTNSGNLIGEFTNNNMSGISTESADITSNYKMKFEGTYETTWFEENMGQKLTLEIKVKETKSRLIYKLFWKKNEIIKFCGIGFIVGKKLIGYYTDDKKTYGNTV